MKKIFFLFAAVMSLLVVGCRDVLLEKNTGGFSVSFQTPGSGSRSGTTATWKLEAWLELESGAQLQKKDDTVPANAPITITFDAVPIGTKLKVQVRLEDSENSLIQHEGSSDWITVDAESKTVPVQVQRMIVNAAAPTIITQPQSQTKEYQAGDEVSWKVTFTVEATSEDGGELSYQWYESSSDTTDGGEKLAEATKQSHEETLTPGETKYFYCVVTNTNDAVNGTKTSTTTSNVAKIVYNIAQSGVLLWKRNVDSGNHNILTAPYGAYDSPADTGITFGASDSSQGTPFCFDGAGNLYVMPSDDQSVFEVKKYVLQPDGTYVDSNTNISTNGQVFNHLAYDSVAGTLYGIGEKAQLCYWKLVGNFEPVQGDTVNAGSYLGLAAHDNVVYCATYAEVQEGNGPILGVVQLSSYKLEDASDGGSKTATSLLVDKTFTLPEVFGSNPPTCQMIYQDGALYLLLGRVDVSNGVPTEGDSERFSCGSLLKINATTLTLESSFGNNGYLGLVDVRSVSGTYNDSPYSMDLYSPTRLNENSAFYGPVGFVAVMPKKLVIGDAGYKLSNKDGGGLHASRKCRVVTVDLETQAFDVASLSDTTFYGNIITSCGFLVVE